MRPKPETLLIGGLALLGLAMTARKLTDWKAKPNAALYLPRLTAAERKYELLPDLLARMAYQESRWRDDIVSGKTVSPAGALGLMQIVPSQHPGVNPLDTSAAIDYAGNFLRGLYKRFGNWRLAVAAYNAGAGHVIDYRDGTNRYGKNPQLQKTGGIPAFAETQAYVRDVFADLA